MNILCLIAGHRRRRKGARPDPQYKWRSECRFCGEPMVRIEHGEWRPEREVRAAEAEPADQD